MAELPVLRVMGRFSLATVDWILTDASINEDLTPVSGTLTFQPGIGNVSINLQVLADEVGYTATTASDLICCVDY